MNLMRQPHRKSRLMGMKPRKAPTVEVSKRLLKDLREVAAMPGRSHHDGGMVISPKEARDLLAVLETPPKSTTQLERQLAACQAENAMLREAVTEGRRALIEVQVLKGVISALKNGVHPLALDTAEDTDDAMTIVDVDVDVDNIVDLDAV
jgi:hypothetical protein